MFMGTYNHSIDTKGRLIMPAKFREQLGETFVVTAGLDSCLFIFSDSAWEKFEEELDALPMSNEDARTYTRYFMPNACSCEVDKQGRILIPGYLREIAGLSKDVVLAGVGRRIEIWDKDRWKAISSGVDMNVVASKMEGLGRK